MLREDAMAGLSRGLTTTERIIVKELKEQGVLKHVDGHRLSLEKGVISCFCADCDRSADIYAHQQGIVREQCKDPRIHMLADNGGPLLITKNSPANKVGRTRDIDFLDSIAFAIEKKGIQTVALIGHAICGVALEREIGLLRTIALILCAKSRIKQDLKRLDPKVACFYHVDYGEFATDPSRPMKTYFIDKHEFARTFPSQHIFTA
ncbi:MAG: hypothetical protein AAB482_01765 [Patescibacteria group bacterium]